MDFTFIHAADLHIDSPLAALGRKNADAAELFAQASRRAVQALIEECLSSNAAFLIIAGDVFDGDWPDMATGLFLVRELGRLERAGIPVFMIRGNHDAESRVSKSLPWPANVREFSTRKAETHLLEKFNIALHGRSFADRRVDGDFVASYPARRAGMLNIGILHTSLDGRPGHDPYAPCSVQTLQNFGYDYWALGHIHAGEIVARDPWIVYPGNLQGRSVRETGAKGAVRVEVSDGRIVAAQHIALDSARWTHEEIDISGCESEEDVQALLQDRLAQAYADGGDRPLAARITLTGQSALHDGLVAGASRFEAEAQAIAARVSVDCWLERVRLKTTTRKRTAPDNLEIKSFDIEGLLGDAAADPAMAHAIAALSQDIRNKFPRDLLDRANEFLPADDAAAHTLANDAQHYLLGSLDGRRA